jgi:hypothetical protein
MAMKMQRGIRHNDSSIRLARFFALFVACGVFFASLPCAHADFLSYDNNVFGSAQDVGMNAAVKFTNTYSKYKMKIESVWVFGNRQTTGDLDLHLWLDAGDGTPGDILASLPGEYLKIKGWQAFDFSSLGIEIDPGASIFAGFHEGTSDYDVNAPYDLGVTTPDRSWYKVGDNGAWQAGAPAGGNLMVRLSRSQGTQVPEVGMLALAAMGVTGCLMIVRRHRAG